MQLLLFIGVSKFVLLVTLKEVEEVVGSFSSVFPSLKQLF